MNGYVSETFRRRKDGEDWALDMERNIDRSGSPKPRAAVQAKTFGDIIDLHIEDGYLNEPALGCGHLPETGTGSIGGEVLVALALFAKRPKLGHEGPRAAPLLRRRSISQPVHLLSCARRAARSAACAPNMAIICDTKLPTSAPLSRMRVMSASP